MPDRSDEARLRAERKFKQKQLQTDEAEKVWAEHAAAGRAADANRAKLCAQRLAKEEADRTEQAGVQTAKAKVARKARAKST